MSDCIIKLHVKDSVNTIINFVKAINETEHMDAVVQPELANDGSWVIIVNTK